MRAHWEPYSEWVLGSLGAVLRREGSVGFGVIPERALDHDGLLREWAYSRRTASATLPGRVEASRGVRLSGVESDFGWFLGELVVALAQ